eukprot:758461-Hanusia_phi.AAC.4
MGEIHVKPTEGLRRGENIFSLPQYNFLSTADQHYKHTRVHRVQCMQASTEIGIDEIPLSRREEGREENQLFMYLLVKMNQ